MPTACTTDRWLLGVWKVAETPQARAKLPEHSIKCRGAGRRQPSREPQKMRFQNAAWAMAREFPNIPNLECAGPGEPTFTHCSHLPQFEVSEMPRDVQVWMPASQHQHVAFLSAAGHPRRQGTEQRQGPPGPGLHLQLVIMYLHQQRWTGGVGLRFGGGWRGSAVYEGSRLLHEELYTQQPLIHIALACRVDLYGPGGLLTWRPATWRPLKGATLRTGIPAKAAIGFHLHPNLEGQHGSNSSMATK
jgi:hypothetical protein